MKRIYLLLIPAFMANQCLAETESSTTTSPQASTPKAGTALTGKHRADKKPTEETPPTEPESTTRGILTPKQMVGPQGIIAPGPGQKENPWIIY